MVRFYIDLEVVIWMNWLARSPIQGLGYKFIFRTVDRVRKIKMIPEPLLLSSILVSVFKSGEDKILSTVANYDIFE